VVDKIKNIELRASSLDIIGSIDNIERFAMQFRRKPKPPGKTYFVRVTISIT
jgi:hypothetical protein